MGSHVLDHCQGCLSVRDREKEIKTGDGQMSRMRKLVRDNTKTFLDVTFRMILDSVNQMLSDRLCSFNVTLNPNFAPIIVGEPSP